MSVWAVRQCIGGKLVRIPEHSITIVGQLVVLLERVQYSQLCAAIVDQLVVLLERVQYSSRR